MNKKLALMAVAASCFALNAFAVADADISTAVTDVDLTWDVVRPVLIGIGVFMIGYGYFKKLRRA